MAQIPLFCYHNEKPMPTNRSPVLAPLAALCLMVLGALAAQRGEARLFLSQDADRWQIFTAEDVDSGVTVPASTNVVFTLPADIGRIARRALLGVDGRAVRYWGYCYPKDYDPKTANPSPTGFPGKMFLSEAERKWRADRLAAAKPAYSVFQPPLRREELNQVRIARSRIRHQIEVFPEDATCYVMSEQPIPLGTDRDRDLLNARLEVTHRTDPLSPDTDGDGIMDGLEVLSLKTLPLFRDTDGDGLIDGVEDRDRDGRTERGETSPIQQDSDGDGLCDGNCRMAKGGRICDGFDTPSTLCRTIAPGFWTGEDKNLNGQRDSGETDPLKWSTLEDGISDLQRYFQCLLRQEDNC